jgi:uncharacterized protein YggE
MMMTKRFAILALALLPLAASAQAPPTRLPPASAGTTGTAGIAVAGTGTVRFTVKTVSFVAYVRGPADEAGALAAMRAAGIDDPVIGPVGSNVSFNGPGVTSVRGTVRDVTPAKLERIGQAAASYMRAHPGSAVDNVNFIPRLDDCNVHEEAARKAALAEARRKAQAIADLAGVTIEGVLSVAENGGCPGPSDGPFVNGGPFDISTLSTTISVYENVTFSIVQGGNNVRRRTL